MRRVQVNQDGLKLNDTHQLWFMLGGSVHIIKRNAEALEVAIRTLD